MEEEESDIWCNVHLAQATSKKDDSFLTPSASWNGHVKGEFGALASALQGGVVSHPDVGAYSCSRLPNKNLPRKK